MTTLYEQFGIGPDATRPELDAAYQAKRAEYDPQRAAVLGEDFVEAVHRRHAELHGMYQELRALLSMPQRLTPDLRRVRERETIVALIVLTVLALLVPLARNVAVPTRTVVANGADAAALKATIAPDFTLTALDGKDVRLSDFKGKIVVINVWATWCPPCVREIPRLVRLSEQYRDQGVVILGINTTWQDDEAKVAQFAREKGISYPVLLDPTNITGPLYRVQLMPSTFVLDHTGRISHTKVGEVDEATLEGYIQTLLAARQEAAQ